MYQLDVQSQTVWFSYYKQTLQYLHKGLSGIKVKWPPKIRTIYWAVVGCNQGALCHQGQQAFLCRLLSHQLYTNSMYVNVQAIQVSYLSYACRGIPQLYALPCEPLLLNILQEVKRCFKWKKLASLVPSVFAIHACITQGWFLTQNVYVVT